MCVYGLGYDAVFGFCWVWSGLCSEGGEEKVWEEESGGYESRGAWEYDGADEYVLDGSVEESCVYEIQ